MSMFSVVTVNEVKLMLYLGNYYLICEFIDEFLSHVNHKPEMSEQFWLKAYYSRSIKFGFCLSIFSNVQL